MKRCKNCNKTKPLEEFYTHPTCVDGYRGKCKKCMNKDAHTYYRKNIDKMIDYEVRRSKSTHTKEIRRRAGKKYRAKNIEKYKCRMKYSYAVEAGLLKRESCKTCGDPNTEGHHTDYSRPYDVIWLCPFHHRLEEGMIPYSVVDTYCSSKEFEEITGKI